MSSYPPPVDRLLTIGEPEFSCHPETWLDYPAEYRLGSRDIPALHQMASDHHLWEASSEEPRAWAPIHAVRALGQLKAKEAIGLLIDLSQRYSEDDWLSNSLPSVFSMIGPAALPAVWASFDGSDGEESWRFGDLEALEAIAKQHPTTRPEIVAGLLHRLENFATQSADLNGFLIDTLVGLDAREGLALVRQVYDVDRVDPNCASWHEVRQHFGVTGPDPLDKGPRQIRKLTRPRPATMKTKDVKKAKRKAIAKAKRRTQSRK